MKIERVIVIFKKSSFQLYAKERRDRRFMELVKSRHPATLRFWASHRKHVDSLRDVREVLRRLKIKADFFYRSQPFSDRDYDLTITVGGDGTFLEAAHRVSRCPILGVNSNPRVSVGNFCAVTADCLKEALQAIMDDTMPSVAFARLRVRIRGNLVPVPVLNDVLVTHANPAATSRYFIRRDRRVEEHKSSGIWIAPAAGSTAAIAGAGGRPLPLRSRKFQFRVRELYMGGRARDCALRGGILGPSEKLVLLSKMRAGRIYFDGSHVYRPFPFGDRAEITSDAPRLRVFGLA